MHEQLTHPVTGERYTAPRCAPLTGDVDPAADLAAADRLVVLGDTHGEVDTVVRALDLAVAVGAAAVVQVGDFGLWPGSSGDRFLGQVDAAAAERRLAVYVVPGNHDDYDRIAAADVDRDGWLVVGDWLRAAPRGHTFTAGGRTLLACGGAASPDGPGGIFGQARGRARRVVWRRSRAGGPAVPFEQDVDLGGWWPQELITDADVDAAVAAVDRVEADGGRVDVLLTHEVPAAVPMLSAGARPFALGEHVRERIDEIAARCAAPLHLAGHWHRHVDTTYQLGEVATRMVVLSANVNPAETVAAVLDLDTLELAARDLYRRRTF